jgi:hypothetical protein
MAAKTGTIFNLTLLRDKLYEFLYPSKIVLGTIRGDPGFLRAPSVSLPSQVTLFGTARIHSFRHERCCGFRQF